MKPIKITAGVTFKIWWAYAWRTILVSMLFAAVFEVLYDVIGKTIGVSEALLITKNLLVFISGIFATAYILYRSLGKIKFKNFTIAVVEKNEDLEAQKEIHTS